MAEQRAAALTEANRKLAKQSAENFKTSQDLQKRTAELEKVNETMIGREAKMIELKAELKKMKGS